MALSTQFEDFKKTLKKVFMLDQADLDFGIYRIMNQKRDQIEDYLNNQLRRQVSEALENNQSIKVRQLQKELQDTIQTLKNLGSKPEEYNTFPKVQELKNQINEMGRVEDLANEVYSHLTIFFSRYYDAGDFMTVRRYKKNAYALPYEGEEVKLYWANADQYYIKTAEYFRDYRFKLDDGKIVEFCIKDATTEQNNNKSQDDMERRFAIFDEEPLEVSEDKLHINFTYELYPKSIKQKKLIEEAFHTIKEKLAAIPLFQVQLLTLCTSQSSRDKTLLQKHLNDYVARNTFDYFIHKDLKGFLTRELDFYIKNEILMIDDIDSKSTEVFTTHLTIIKAIKNVGEKLIQFLSSLENFQKRLWLKKKIIVSTNFCITLDRVPDTLYAEISTNKAQCEEWIELFSINKLPNFSFPFTIDFLKVNRFLVLDTCLFTEEFKHKLVSSIENLDNQCTGLLIKSENFQALNLIQNKYQGRIKCVYIDPPYNSPHSEIPYKNSFKHSSWLSLLNDRLLCSKRLLTQDGSHVIAIDKYEQNRLSLLIESIFPNFDNVTVPIEHNRKGVQGDHFSYNNEYAIFSVPYTKGHLNEIPRAEEDWEWSPLRNWGSESERKDAANCFYPIYVKNQDIIGYGDVSVDDYHPLANVKMPLIFEYYDNKGRKSMYNSSEENEVVAIFPIDIKGVERKWRYAFQKIKNIIPFLRVKESNNGLDIEFAKTSDQFKTMWYHSKYNAGDYGTKVLTNMGIDKSKFKFPKSVYTTQDCIYAVSEGDDIVLDYFAGSGTTGHAVLDLNRRYGEHRRFILAEMGDYFDTVTKPRIEKVIYSKEWKNGIPEKREGMSSCVKYIQLEQYEDVLNNLIVRENPLLSKQGEFYDSYVTGYMLDTETKDSLFTLEWFKNPWDIKLKISCNNISMVRNVDLIETFNYLLGVTVYKMYYPKSDICVIEGENVQKEKLLIIWRNCLKVSNGDLDTFFTKMQFSTHDSKFDKIYVNGDNNLSNLRSDDDSWKVMLIEKEFQQKMFE